MLLKTKDFNCKSKTFIGERWGIKTRIYICQIYECVNYLFFTELKVLMNKFLCQSLLFALCKVY